MPIRNLQLTSAQISNIGCPQIKDISDQLPVNKNYTWGELAGIRDVNDLTTIALHHDCYPKKNVSGYSDLKLAQDIAEDHIKLTKNEAKGDAGFPYHIWIRNGQAYQTNDLLPRTYGVGSNNGYTVHICVSGEYFKTDVLTDVDRAALYGAIIAVIGELPNYKEIKGHKEFQYNNTSCPGYDYNKVRDDISKLILSIKVAESPEQTLSNLFKNVNQHIYLYNQYKADPIGQKWLEPYLTKIHQITIDMNMYFDK